MAKGEPTSLNLWSLNDAFKGRTEIPNQLPPASVPHIRRCFAAGLVEVKDRSTLRMTPKGCQALAEWCRQNGKG